MSDAWDRGDAAAWTTPRGPQSARPNGQGAKDWQSEPWDHPLDPWHHLDLPRLQGLEIPKRRFVVPPWVPVHETTGLGGAGGDGKTLLAQMLTTAAALDGRQWLGINVERIKTFALLCEDRELDVWIRQENINRLYNCDFGDLENMRMVPRRSDARNRLMIFDRNGIGHLTTFFFQLLQEARNFGAQLTILDTKSDLFLGNQNDEDQARTFVRQCTDRIAEETDGACILIYHPSRAGLRDGTGESGSVQWDAAFRSRLLLERLRPDEGEPDPYARVLTRKKSNFALRDETIEMKWEEGVFLRTDTPAPSGVLITARKLTASRVFLELLEQHTKAGRRLSDSSASPSNYAPKVFARHPGRQGVKFKEFVTAMEELFALGKIIVTDTGRARWITKSEVA